MNNYSKLSKSFERLKDLSKQTNIMIITSKQRNTIKVGQIYKRHLSRIRIDRILRNGTFEIFVWCPNSNSVVSIVTKKHIQNFELLVG